MPVIIRVHPQYGYRSGLGLNGLGYGGYGVGGYAGIQLRNEKQKHALQLKYERALFNERLKTVQLQTAVQSGGTFGAVGGVGALGAVGGMYSPYGVVNPYQNLYARQLVQNQMFTSNNMFGNGLFGLF